MKYHFIGITFIGSGLILLLNFFLVLVPTVSGMGSGAWVALLFPIVFLVFLLCVLDIIWGLLSLIKQKAYERTSIKFGVLSLIVGLIYMYTWWYYVWGLTLFLFISGIIMLYLGFAKSWK